MCKSSDQQCKACPEPAFSTVVVEEDGEALVIVRPAGRHLSPQVSQALCCRYEAIVGAVRQFLGCVAQTPFSVAQGSWPGLLRWMGCMESLGSPRNV